MVIQKRATPLFVILGLGILLALTFLIIPSDTYAQDSATPTSIIPSPQPPASQPTTSVATQAPTQIVPTGEPTAVSGVSLAQEAALSAFRIDDIRLNSPVGVGQLDFDLPDNWRPVGQTRLSLNLEYFETIPNNATVGGRTVNLISIIDVYLNDDLISTITLDSSDAGVGPQDFEILLPTNLLEQAVNNRFLVSLVLRAKDHCLINSEARVIMHSDASFIRTEYQEIAPDLDLALFPYPIYFGSFDGQLDSIYVILPDTPTLSDLQAAASVVAGLGRQAFNDFVIKYRTPSTTNPAELATANLIAIGSVSQNEIIADWLDQELLSIQQTDDGDWLLGEDSLNGRGYLELIPNPQNPLRVALVVTGTTSEGVELAARSLTFAPNLTGISSRSSIITALPEPPAIPIGFYPDDIVTFADLGVSEIRLSALGTSSTVIDLPVSFHSRLVDPSYLDFNYRFSSILEDAGAILNLILNDETPLATFYLQSEAVQADAPSPQGMPQTARISLPPDAMLSGIENSIAITIETDINWNCNPPQQEDTWLIINDDSTFSLSFEPVSLDSLTPEVSWFPAPFNSLSDMSNVWISLPEEPTYLEIEQVLRLIGLISSLTTQGRNFQPHLSIGEIPSGVDVSQYHFIVFGRPSTNPLLRMLNDNLPQPFSSDSDQLAQIAEEIESPISLESNLGVLQIFPSIWSNNHLILVITGTDSIGQSNAISILVEQAAGKSQLEGDVVLVQDGSVLAQSSEDLAESAEFLASINELGTQVALEATAAAQPISTITPGPSPTPTLTTTPAPTNTPTPLFSLTPSATVPTPLPTFAPLHPETLKPAKLEQPAWVNLASIGVGILVVISVLFGALQLFRSGQKGNR